MLVSTPASIITGISETDVLDRPVPMSRLAAQYEDCCVAPAKHNDFLMTDTEPPRGLMGTGREKREVIIHRCVETPPVVLASTSTSSTS